MKKVLLVLVFSMIAVAFSVVLPGDNQLFALSGCCKQRASYGAPWYPNGMNFQDCANFNENTDGDDVFNRRGLVWWDVNC